MASTTNQVKGISIQLGLDATQLKKDLGDVSRTLKEQQGELRKIEKDMKFDTSPLDGLNRKQEKLADILGTVSREIEIQQRIVANAREQFSLGLIDEKAVTNAQDKLDRLTYSYKSYALSLRQTEESIARLRLEERQVKWDNLIGLGKQLSVLSAGIVAGFTAIVAAANGVTESISSIDEAATEAGIAVEDYQRLTYASQMLGVKSETMGASLRKVYSVLGQIASGSGESYSEALGKLGLSFEELSSEGTVEAFYDIVDALREMGDTTDRLGIVTTLFGEDLATKVLPYIEAGSQALEDYGDQASTVTQEQVALSKQFQAMTGNLKTEFLSVFAELLPTINEALEWFVGLVRDDIAPAAKELIERFNALPDSVKKGIAAFAGIGAVAGPLLLVIGNVGKGVTELTSSIGGLIGGASKGGLLGLVAAHPGVAAALAGIAAILGTAYAKDEDFRESVNALGKELMAVLGEIGKIVSELWTETIEPLWDRLSGIFSELLQELLPPLTSALRTIASAIGPIVQALQPLADILASQFVDQMERLAGFIGMIAGILDALSPILDMVASAVSTIAGILEPLFSAAKTFFDWIGDALEKVGDSLGSFFDWLIGILGKAGEALASFGEKIVDLMKDQQELNDEIAVMPLPMLANRNTLEGNRGIASGTESRNYYITINTSASRMTLEDIDDLLGNQV